MNFNDPEFEPLFLDAVEQVKEPGEFASIGQTDWVVCMNVNREHFIWDIDLLGDTDTCVELVALIHTLDGAAREIAWKAFHESHNSEFIRWRTNRAKGAADPAVTAAAKYAVELRAKAETLSKRKAANMAADAMAAQGIHVSAEAIRKRL